MWVCVERKRKIYKHTQTGKSDGQGKQTDRQGRQTETLSFILYIYIAFFFCGKCLSFCIKSQSGHGSYKLLCVTALDSYYSSMDLSIVDQSYN